MEKWLAFIIRLILERISPEIKQMIRKWLEEAEAKAKQTPNPFDDLIVDILKFLLLPTGS